MKLKNMIAVLLAFCLLFSGTVAYMDTEIGEEDPGTEEASTGEMDVDAEEEEIEFDEEAPARPAIEYMVKVSENSYLELYINEETTEAAVKVKATGDIWYTNPEKRNADPLASGINRELLAAQINISYFTRTAQMLQMNNFRDSIHRNQFEIEPIDNGVRINYRIGKEEEIFVVPLIISAERMTELIFDKLETRTIRMIERSYRLFSLASARNESQRNEWLAMYPTLEDHDLYVLRDGVRTFVIREIEEAILGTGYTLEDMNEDHLANNAPITEPNKDIFTIPLEYILEEDTLLVRIPTQEIEYHHQYFPLYRLQLLQFFGAADSEQEGYILVPDGSGSLIYLNNGKHTMPAYVTDIYGRDRGLPLPERFGMVEQAYLPVFGMKQGDRAFFAIIEDGDGVGRIWADVSGRLTSYNNVFTEFILLQKDEFQSGNFTGLSTILVHQPRIFDGDIKVRYAFLSGADASYAGMARYYREYLVNRGKMRRIEPQENIPFYLEVVGAISRMRPILGIPVRQLEPLTRYADAAEMVRMLQKNGIDNVILRYTGWFNGGVNHTVPMHIRLIRRLGGRRGFNQLLEFVKQNGIPFYPEAGVMYAYNTRWLDGFTPRAHASRFINRIVAAVFLYNPATSLEDFALGRRYVISPARIPALINGLINGLNKFSITNIALRDAAKEVSADYREGRLVDRQQATRIMAGEFRRLTESGFSVMADGGNAYALPYLDHILHMPLESNRFLITDESVPFLQMVVRGYVDYAGSPINLSQDHRHNFLKSIETGANLYFCWIYEDNAVVKHTQYDYLFSADYRVWMDEALAYYRRANEALGPVHGLSITDHRQIMPNVFMTTYENGREIIVNYNSDAVTVRGVTIGGLDFAVAKEGN